MNNMFTTGLLAISIIALNGCKESIDLTSNTHRSSTTTSTTDATSNTSGGETGSIVVTTAPVKVIKIVDITNETTTDETTEEETTETTETETENEETETVVNNGSTTATCEVEATTINPFVRVQMHYGLLSGTPFISGELAGLDTLTVTEDAAQGSRTLKLDSTVGLVSGQLITYVGSNGHNRAGKVGDVSADQITIVSGDGLETNITSGSLISNFYFDETHPNTNGYKAIADFGLRSAYPIVPAQKHVLLGDSWFGPDEVTGTTAFQSQLESRLTESTIINAGVGGNTLCDLISRFEEDVTAEAPQYVWINSSVNDYYNDVSPVDYKTRMQYLIGQVQQIGATAIVFDSAPSADTSPTGTNLSDYSNGYAGALLEIFAESQQ